MSIKLIKEISRIKYGVCPKVFSFDKCLAQTLSDTAIETKSELNTVLKHLRK